MGIDIRQLLVAGHEELQRQHREQEKTKNSFRVGSSGVVIGEEVYGTCHRISHLRDLGIETKPSLSTDIMFKAGEANEYNWERIMAASGFDGEIRAHDEVSAVVEGVDKPIEGHPDSKLILKDGDKKLGVELKGIFGWSTAELIWAKRTPKTANLVQMALYSVLDGIDYCLVYTCPHFPKVPHWEKKKIEDRLREEFGNNWMAPFYAIFYTQWVGGKLQYRHEQETEWVCTEVTAKRIYDYYRLLTEMRQKKKLGPRVNSHYLNGEENKWGKESDCGLCEFKSACDSYDMSGDYQAWLDMAKERLSET